MDLDRYGQMDMDISCQTCRFACFPFKRNMDLGKIWWFQPSAPKLSHTTGDPPQLTIHWSAEWKQQSSSGIFPHAKFLMLIIIFRNKQHDHVVKWRQFAWHFHGISQRHQPFWNQRSNLEVQKSKELHFGSVSEVNPGEKWWFNDHLDSEDWRLK